MHVSPASLRWDSDHLGRLTPYSLDFNQHYYSLNGGLEETRYVFLKGNLLQQRLTSMPATSTLTVGELGFGTGLNFLATCQLVQSLRPSVKLHFITTESFALSAYELKKALDSWPELSSLAALLIDQYPEPTPGLHRLHLGSNITLDLWFADSLDALNSIEAPAGVDAWFLDGFSPAANPSMWELSLFKQIKRLSRPHTTAASFSASRALKDALEHAGFHYKKVKGHGNKRHMLIAAQTKAKLEQWSTVYVPCSLAAPASLPSATHPAQTPATPQASKTPSQPTEVNLAQHSYFPVCGSSTKDHAVIVGAGVAGLCLAYKLSGLFKRITLVDSAEPLSGASGNPAALLAPKLAPFHKAALHLHTLSFFYAKRFYQQLEKQSGAQFLHSVGAVDQLQRPEKQNAYLTYYPESVVCKHSSYTDKLWWPVACSISPHKLKQALDQLIDYRIMQALVTSIETHSSGVCVHTQPSSALKAAVKCPEPKTTLKADAVFVCAGAGSTFLKQLQHARTTRGQLEICTATKPSGLTELLLTHQSADQNALKLPTEHFDQLPALKYGGYLVALDSAAAQPPSVVVGATNDRGTLDPHPSAESTQANLSKLSSSWPTLAQALTPSGSRVSFRLNMPDHSPMIGSLAPNLYVLSALGSKGFCYAPLGAELIKSLLTQSPLPLPLQSAQRVNPKRFKNKPL